MSGDLTESGGTRVPTIALKLISESIGGLQKLADAQDRMTRAAQKDSEKIAQALDGFGSDLRAVVESNHRVADRMDALVTALASQPPRQEVTIHGPSQEAQDDLAKARAEFYRKLTWVLGAVATLATGGGVAAYFANGGQ